MNIRTMDVSNLLFLNKFKVYEKEAHIVLDKESCAKCGIKPCLVVCPASLYTLDENNQVCFNYAGCLECGTCRIMCENRGIIKWQYPRGNFGVTYQKG